MKETNRTMIQFFEWYLPANSRLWARAAHKAAEMRDIGINMIWLPPAYKGASGDKSIGYDVYDTYDLGEFDQKGSVATKYGTKDEYIAAVKALQQAGIQVYADVVLNHMMGADEAETVTVTEVAADNRYDVISGEFDIAARTRFTFPGRGGKYSDRQWSASNFSGVDWDDSTGRRGVFLFRGKHWNGETDCENANYDYLMGADLDTDDPDTAAALTEWGKWYLDTVGMDGFRLDAVKHMSFAFYKNWAAEMRAHAGRDLFIVGEYWSADLARLTHYLEVLDHSVCLFDVPLHYALQSASASDGNFDMSCLFDNCLLSVCPDNAVTFVDNHDTQPEQALQSFILPWFKPIAYALILLQQRGTPCIFYGDLYGIPHDNVAPLPELRALIKVRELYAYGPQHDYFNDADVVGLTREGDEEHENSGLVLLVTNRAAGTKRMYTGPRLAGVTLYDIFQKIEQPVVVGDDGYADFSVRDGSLSLYMRKEAFDLLFDIT